LRDREEVDFERLEDLALAVRLTGVAFCAPAFRDADFTEGFGLGALAAFLATVLEAWEFPLAVFPDTDLAVRLLLFLGGAAAETSWSRNKKKVPVAIRVFRVIRPSGEKFSLSSSTRALMALLTPLLCCIGWTSVKLQSIRHQL
jgi:hypothetical protein